MEDERLARAAELVQAGQLEQARTALELILKEDRHNIAAWRAYAATWPKRADQMRVWEICLRNNPDAQEAQQALAELKPGRSPETHPARSDVYADIYKKPSTSSPWLLGGLIGVLAVVAIVALVAVAMSKPKDPAAYRHTAPVEYYLYVPKKYSVDQAWPLFVHMHGSGGSGLECWNLWQAYAEREGYILLCPTIPGDAGGYYQDVGERTVWSAIGAVQKDYRVQSKLFMSGFSAGAFFIQGFAYHYPQTVGGLAILSAGNYLDPGAFSTYVPMLVVIGSWDNGTAIQTSQLFATGLSNRKFEVQYEVLPNVGHTVTRKGVSLTLALFRKTMK